MGLQETLFGKTNYKPIVISEPLRDSVNVTAGSSLNRYRRRAGETLDAFQLLADRTLPKVEGAIQLGQNDINSASSLLKGLNPLSNYERIREGNLTSIKGLSDWLAGIGRRQEGQLAARLGMAGRPMSSARDLIRSSGASSALSPLVQSIFSNLGSDNSGISRDVMNQAAGLRSMANARPDLYGSLYNYALAPLDAERMSLGGETDTLNALAQAVKSNYAGMDVQKKMGIMDYPVRMSENLSATVGNIADAAGSVAGIAGSFMGGMGGMGGLGGMMGGMGGGGGGGGGRGTNQSPNMNWGGWQPNNSWMGSYSAPQTTFDVNSLSPIQMMMFDRAKNYGSQNVPPGSVWE